jgi:site-specific DNA-methyltransferase (adenine-specific)
MFLLFKDYLSLSLMNKIDTNQTNKEMDKMDKTVAELRVLCKELQIKGVSGKNKAQLVELLQKNNEEPKVPKEQLGQIIHGDSIQILPTLATESAQMILADPPYNIGKDFGNDSDKQPMDNYLAWCEAWIKECLRILKPNGTMFIFGFSENLALILSKIPHDIQRRWLIWHYTNKNVPSLNFWQRSHESILVLWKEDKVFHRDEIREAYTEGFLNGAAGKVRQSTKGRFSKGEKKTTYMAHANGALPRDVIKIPALAGGSGKERVNHPTQKPLLLCDKLIKSCKQTDGYVLVPFAGSGSECLAAKNNNLSYIGIEINPEYISLIHERLEQTNPDQQTS